MTTLLWWYPDGLHRVSGHHMSREYHELPQRQRQFWALFYHDLTESRPECAKIFSNEGLDVTSLEEAPCCEVNNDSELIGHHLLDSMYCR
jgi:hypothetical protein